MPKQPSLAELSLKKGGSAPTAQKTSETVKELFPQTKRKGQTLRLQEGAWKALKHLAVDKGIPTHDLLIEAVNDLFSKYGKPPIA